MAHAKKPKGKEKKKAKAGLPANELLPAKREKQAAAREGTKRLICTCFHKFQDATYGPKVRVFNQAGKGPGSWCYRCTVCLREVEV